MKKIFTIMLLATGTVHFAFAQSRNQQDIAYNDNNNKTYTDRHYSNFDKPGNSDYFSMKSKQEKLQRINRDYEQKIAFVKNSWRFSRREKASQVKLLQLQWKNEINQVELAYAKNDHHEYDKMNDHDMHRH
jgi:hypothetical protein